jgi:hypothetical protein
MSHQCVLKCVFVVDSPIRHKVKIRREYEHVSVTVSGAHVTCHVHGQTLDVSNKVVLLDDANSSRPNADRTIYPPSATTSWTRRSLGRSVRSSNGCSPVEAVGFLLELLKVVPLHDSKAFPF